MKTTVTLPKHTVEGALQMVIKSLKRRQTTEINPLIIELIDKDIEALQNAINTAVEGK